MARIRRHGDLKLLASVTEADGKDENDLFCVHPLQFPAAGSYKTSLTIMFIYPVLHLHIQKNSAEIVASSYHVRKTLYLIYII